MDEKRKLEYEDWYNHMKDHSERSFYSIKRMDLLIIIISGGGIYLAFDLIGSLGQVCDFKNGGLLFTSALCLLIAISLNFIGQHIAQKANDKEEEYARIQLNVIKGKNIDKKQKQQIGDKIRCLSLRIRIVDSLSKIGMFSGIVLLTIFYYLCLFQG